MDAYNNILIPTIWLSEGRYPNTRYTPATISKELEESIPLIGYFTLLYISREVTDSIVLWTITTPPIPNAFNK